MIEILLHVCLRKPFVEKSIVFYIHYSPTIHLDCTNMQLHNMKCIVIIKNTIDYYRLNSSNLCCRSRCLKHS